jgi:uncharacterized membrane protein YeiB
LDNTRWSPPQATGVSGLDAPGQGPLAPSQRIEAIDVLRGLALLGVIAIHVVFEFRVDIFEQFLEAAFSAWWLGRYRYGPVEWLWRSLMHGTWQPMLRRRR